MYIDVYCTELVRIALFLVHDTHSRLTPLQNVNVNRIESLLQTLILQFYLFGFFKTIL